MSTELSGFSDLHLLPALLKAIADAGYQVPTPIQMKAIPIILQGDDLLATAQTGTGKTAAFTLPLLQRLTVSKRARAKPGQPRCLVLTPTRELVLQVERSVKTYGQQLPLKSQAVFGGVKINPQRMAMRKPVDILIATPGRMLDLIGQNIVRMNDIDILVVDEADRMLDMGFINDVRKILSLLPKRRQSLLFSATFSNDIRQLANSLLIKPLEISLTPRTTSIEKIKQVVYLVDQSRKRSLLDRLIREHDWTQVLVFTKTRQGANRLAEKLGKTGIEALAMHGDKSQAARTQALAKFKDGSLHVLIATDLAARGIDVENLPCVVNYDMPHVSELYSHRIGRTGRADNVGQAISLVNTDEVKLLKKIEKLIGKTLPRADIDGLTGHSETRSSADTKPQIRAPRRKLPKG